MALSLTLPSSNLKLPNIGVAKTRVKGKGKIFFRFVCPIFNETKTFLNALIHN